MDKLKAIIKREYLTRVRSKGFIIGTILSPLVMSSFIFVPFFIGRSAGPTGPWKMPRRPARNTSMAAPDPQHAIKMIEAMAHSSL